MASSCAEKRTMVTPLNDLTPAPSTEMLMALKLQDCAQKVAALKRVMSPLDLTALVSICPTQEMSAEIKKLKDFSLEKNLERIYIVESGISDIGFDLEGVKSLKLSMAGVNDLASLEALWKSHERELDKAVDKIIDNRLSQIYMESIVTQSRRELNKLQSLLRDLNGHEEFIRWIDQQREVRGDFPVYLSDKKCEVTNAGLYLRIKPHGIFGSARGALRKCFKSF